MNVRVGVVEVVVEAIDGSLYCLGCQHSVLFGENYEVSVCVCVGAASLSPRMVVMVISTH